MKILKCIDENGLDYYLVVTSRGTILGVFGKSQEAEDFIEKLLQKIRTATQIVKIETVLEVKMSFQDLFSDWADLFQKAVVEELSRDDQERSL